MSAVGDARKRLTTLAAEADAKAAALPVERGLPGYFIEADAHGDAYVWREVPGRPDYPQPVLAGWSLMRDDPELWAAIVAMVEGS